MQSLTSMVKVAESPQLLAIFENVLQKQCILDISQLKFSKKNMNLVHYWFLAGEATGSQSSGLLSLRPWSFYQFSATLKHVKELTNPISAT